MSNLDVVELRDARSRHEMAVFPWRVYRGDKNWVPPIIKDREKLLDPSRNAVLRNGDAALFGARRDDGLVGTIAAYVDRGFNDYLHKTVGWFGFFEVLDDYEAAEALLGTARDWVRKRGMSELRGPMNFHRDRERGILVEGADCPPPLLCGHSPPYYAGFVERFGMVKHADDFARRVPLDQWVAPDGTLAPRLARLQKVAQRRTGVSIRRASMADWDAEVQRVRRLYDATIGQMPDHVPWTDHDIQAFAEELRPLVHPDFCLFGEIEGKTVGFAVAVPDFNQVLVHLDGYLDGINKLRAWWYMKRINVLSSKVGGVLVEYQGLGIEALFLLQIATAAAARGYRWIEMSLQAEGNEKAGTVVKRLGAEDYKRYRLYKLPL